MIGTFSLLFFVACTAGSDEEDSGSSPDDVGTECGDPTTYDIEISARVVDGKGTGLGGMRVYLDDRGYTYAELGEGSTRATGDVTFTATGVTWIDDCPGLLDYWIVVVDPSDDARTAEDDMNTQLYNSIQDGSLAVDVSEFPLELL